MARKPVWVIICRSLEGNFCTQWENQQKHFRERLSSEQLKPKETPELIGHVTAALRLLLPLLLLRLLLLWFCFFRCGVLLYPNIFGIFNFFRFDLLKVSGLLGFCLYVIANDGCCQLAWWLLVEKNEFTFAWDKYRTDIAGNVTLRGSVPGLRLTVHRKCSEWSIHCNSMVHCSVVTHYETEIIHRECREEVRACNAIVHCCVRALPCRLDTKSYLLQGASLRGRRRPPAMLAQEGKHIKVCEADRGP